MAFLLLVGSLILPGGSPAEGQPLPADPAEILRARVRYGVSLRSGGQRDLGPGASYQGTTPNDLALGATYFAFDFLGLGVLAQREAFSLTGQGARLGSLGLWRLGAGPVLRYAHPCFRLEGGVGYQLAQLPLLTDTAAPSLGFARRHALTVGARGQIRLPYRLALELRGEAPVPLSTTTGSGFSARSFGFTAGAALTWRMGNIGRLAYSSSLDYELVHDRVWWNDAAAVPHEAAQRMSRVGVVLEIQWLAREPSTGPTVGGLLASVVDQENGEPLAKVVLTLQKPGDAGTVWPQQTGTDGQVELSALSPGVFDLSAELPGYERAQASATVVAGQTQRVELLAKKKPPPTGGLVVTVVDKLTKLPLPGAKLTLAGRSVEADVVGKAKLEGLPPGPLAIGISASGYSDSNEVASVVASKESAMTLELAPVKKRIPATITGIIRSTQGGEPVVATLEVRELKLVLETQRDGRFSTQLPGGRYSVIISAPGFNTQSKWVTVQDGAQVIFNVDLHPLR